MISYCPQCGAQIRWNPPQDTRICGGCGEWWFTEFLLPEPLVARLPQVPPGADLQP